MSFKEQAIYNTHSNVISITAGTDAYDKNGSIVALDGSKISIEEARLQAEYDAQEYARQRKSEYPAIADQLDEIYHNGIDSWKAVIKVTKDKYPKG